MEVFNPAQEFCSFFCFFDNNWIILIFFQIVVDNRISENAGRFIFSRLLHIAKYPVKYTKLIKSATTKKFRGGSHSGEHFYSQADACKFQD